MIDPNAAAAADAPLLAPDQVAALESVLDWLADDEGEQVAVIVGPAGSGKTTLIREVIARVGDARTVRCIAPTGKAALRLGQVLGTPRGWVKTIHAALYAKVEETETETEKSVTDAGGNTTITTTKATTLTFGDAHAPCEPGDLVICDEASMVASGVYGELVEQLPPGARLLFFGDDAQLAPVNDKWGCDFAHPLARLETVHRVALNSAIVRFATAIRTRAKEDWGPGPEVEIRKHAPPADAARWLAERRKAGIDATLLTWTNAVRRETNDRVRQLRELYDGPQVTDYLVVTQNSRTHGMFNGEVFPLTFAHPLDNEGNYAIRRAGHGSSRVDMGEAEIDIPIVVNAELFGKANSDFRDYLYKSAKPERLPWLRPILAAWVAAGRKPEHFGRFAQSMWLQADWGECLTIHKGQGSEWQEVGVVLANMAFLKRKDLDEWHRLVYTACTRPRKKLVVFISESR